MADNYSGPQKTIDLETIDKIRKNIGPISQEEALMMQKKLGGEILKEAESNYQMPTSKPYAKKGTTVSQVGDKYVNNKPSSNVSSGNDSIPEKPKATKKPGQLPSIDPREEKLMNNLMMSNAYKIKVDHGIFNFIYNLSSKNRDKLNPYFVSYILNTHMQNIEGFQKTIQTLIQLAPGSYQRAINFEVELKYKFLKDVSSWSVNSMKTRLIDVQALNPNVTISDMAPFIKEVYKDLLKVSYLGEQAVSMVIKEVYKDLQEITEMNEQKLQAVAKKGIREWVYIYNNVIKGLYPILMRLVSTTYVEFPKFFLVKSKPILDFTGLSKYDLLTQKNIEKKVTEKKAQELLKSANENKEKPSTPKNVHVSGQKDALVDTGLKILDQMFPKAGFNRLDQHPDMFPYFQPLYHFGDGFNMLSPVNPLQITIVLIRIIKDFLQGCRNVQIGIYEDDKLSKLSDDFNNVISDWASYYEDLFEKQLGDYIRNYANSLYTQDDFLSTSYGKDTLNNTLQRTKLYFCPNYSFAQPSLQKLNYDARYIQLYKRTDYMKVFLTTLVQRIDEASKSKTTVQGVSNPWDKYTFELPNEVSRRLDVLLGAKKDPSQTKATNATLMKYTLCVVSVLDWWINNPQSPAYAVEFDGNNYLRMDMQTGKPQFNVPIMNNQNALFVESLKAQAARQQQK